MDVNRQWSFSSGTGERITALNKPDTFSQLFAAIARGYDYLTGL